MSSKILACVDHTKYADFVTDYASWAAAKLQNRLELIHLLDCGSDAQKNRNCEKGYDIQSVLMRNYLQKDEKQMEMLKEKGDTLLRNLTARTEKFSPSAVETKQMTGTLIGALMERQTDSSLLVIGRKGRTTEPGQTDPIRNLEYIIKSVNLPILTVPSDFKEPKRVMVTYDGSPASKYNITRLIETNLLKDTSIYLLMCGNSNPNRLLEWAHDALIEAGLDASSAFIPENPLSVIPKEVRKQSIDMVVIGAYTSSPLVRIVVGSKTNELLSQLRIPALIIK